MNSSKINYIFLIQMVMLLLLSCLSACQSDDKTEPEVVDETPEEEVPSDDMETDSVQLIEHKLLLNLAYPDQINLFSSGAPGSFFLAVNGFGNSGFYDQVYLFNEKARIDWVQNLTPAGLNVHIPIGFSSSSQESKVVIRENAIGDPEGMIISSIDTAGIITGAFSLKEDFGFNSSDIPPVTKIGDHYVLSWVKRENTEHSSVHRVIAFNAEGTELWRDDFTGLRYSIAKTEIHDKHFFYAYQSLDSTGITRSRIRIFDENGQAIEDFYLASNVLPEWGFEDETIVKLLVEENIIYVLFERRGRLPDRRIAKYSLTGELLDEVEIDKKLYDFDLYPDGLWFIGNDLSFDYEVSTGKPFILKTSKNLEVSFQSQFVDVNANGLLSRIIAHENGTFVAIAISDENYRLTPFVASLDHQGQIIKTEE
ncbi:MAG: hypothetical protein R8G66_23255 [Cytophagales bacterium]|nr:hypothetical protein [Cytophagales bacterium]